MSWNTYFTTVTQSSSTLQVINFGFTLPTSATITGIVVDVNCIGGGLGLIRDYSATLIINGVAQDGAGGTPNSNQAISTTQFVSDVPSITVSYGNISSKWNTNVSTANANAANFGVGLRFICVSNSWNGSGQYPFLRVFSVTMKIYYSTGGSSTTSFVQENMLYGCKRTGRIYTLSEYIQYDYTDPILFVKRTGIITYDTLKNKRVDRLHIRLRKGIKNPQLLVYKSISTPHSATEHIEGGYMHLLWYNNYSDGFEQLTNWVKIVLNDNKTFSEVPLYRLGVYRSRQYEIIVIDPVPFMLIEMEEEVTMLRD